MKNLFGPLGKEYCILFYFLSIFSFIGLILFSVSALYRGITTKKDIWYYLGVLVVAFVYFFHYIQNRLLFSMCSGTMK